MFALVFCEKSAIFAFMDMFLFETKKPRKGITVMAFNDNWITPTNPLGTKKGFLVEIDSVDVFITTVFNGGDYEYIEDILPKYWTKIHNEYGK